MSLCVRAKSLQSCLTLCNPMDCSPPGSSVHGILQARILEWVAISFSKGSSWPRNQTYVSYSFLIAYGFFTTEPPRKPNVWFYNLGNAGLVEWLRKCSPCFLFLEDTVVNHYHFFLKSVEEFTSEAILARCFLFWKHLLIQFSKIGINLFWRGKWQPTPVFLAIMNCQYFKYFI